MMRAFMRALRCESGMEVHVSLLKYSSLVTSPKMRNKKVDRQTVAPIDTPDAAIFEKTV